MREYHVGLVVEGPTDTIIISALLSRLIGSNITVTTLQPDISETPGFGTYGGGWKGVRDWCQHISEKGSIYEFVQGSNPLDLLIIQVDCDISRDSEIQCAKPCPPIQPTIDELENVVKHWLKVDDIHCPIVLTIPADNLETWMLVALESEQNLQQMGFIECINHPIHLLRGKPIKFKKSQTSYRKNSAVFLKKWETIKQFCTQAAAFEQKILECKSFLP